jgi:hypothetical protein
MKTENTTTTENIFSGLKVVDLASFIAGPGAAVILSDFGADVIKVEPPKGELWRIGNKIPRCCRSVDLPSLNLFPIEGKAYAGRLFLSAGGTRYLWGGEPGTPAR